MRRAAVGTAGAAALLVWGLLSGLVAAPAAAAPPGATDPSAPLPPGGRVLLVGVPGLSGADLADPAMPVLRDLASRGGVGVLSVRSATEQATRPPSGWATVSAGNRARLVGPGDAVLLPDGRGLRDPSVPQIRSDVAGLDLDSEVGALGDAVHASGGCTAVVGSSRGPVLALADATGRVDEVLPGPGPGTSRCGVVAVGLDGVAEGSGPQQRSSVDAALAAVLADAAPGDRVLVAGLSDRTTGTWHLRLLVTGSIDQVSEPPRGTAPARLRSASTRRAPFVQTIDLAPTILAALGLPAPPSMTGQPITAAGRWSSLSAAAAGVQDADRRAQAVRGATVWVFLPYSLLLTGLLVATGRRRARRLPLPALCRWAGGWSAATFLVCLLPWWRWPGASAWLLGLLLTASAVVAAVGSRAQVFRLGAAGGVAAVTAGVLAVDLLTGAHLQLSSPFGYSPLVAGRFAGIGNLAFGVLAAAGLLALGAAAGSRTGRARLAVVLGGGAALVLLDGGWGSDVGGVLALVPALVVLEAALSGRRLALGRLAGAGAAAVLAVAGLAALDLARPPARRSHLGRFAQQVLDGTAGTTITRKLDTNVALLIRSPGTLFLAGVAAACTVAVLAPGRLRLPRLDRLLTEEPGWRAGLLGVLVATGLGFMVNDSGLAVVAGAGAVALPLTLAAVARVPFGVVAALEEPRVSDLRPVDAPGTEPADTFHGGR